MAGKKPIEQDITEKAADFRDVDIEYQLLAYAIRENPVVLGTIKREWLSDILLQDVFTVASDLKIKLSKAMIMTELKDRNIMTKKETGLFDDALDQLFDVNTAPIDEKTMRHMMSQLLRLSESRKLLTACGQVIGTMREFDLDKAKRKLASVSQDVAVSVENGVYYLDDYEHRVEALREKEDQASEEGAEAGVRTGLYTFDRITGGLMPKEFGVIAGVTNVGKTAALIEFGVNAYENGHNVFIGSGEMSVDELAFRIDSRLTQIHGMKFRKAELEDEDYKKWESTVVQYRATRDNVLFIAAYPRRFTCSDFDRDIRRVEEETGQRIEVCCLDYINITDPIQKGRSDWKDQSEAVWDFKALCVERNMVGWTAGQVVDDAYDKELYDASDLKYARAISEAAPVIIALIRTDKDIIEGRMKLQVIKMRNAEVAKHPIKLTPNFGIMRLHVEEKKRTASLADLPDNVIEMSRKARKPKSKRRAKS